MKSRVSLLLGAAVLGVCWSARPVRAGACATCDCGDPTLVVMGAEQPFDHRLRVSMMFRHRTDAVGQVGVDEVQLSEQRLELATAYAPSQWLMLSASVPLLRRQLDHADLTREGYVGIGDSELRSRWIVYRDRELSPQHLLAFVVGLKLPTGPTDASSSGAGNLELLAGTGSWDPLLGITYSWFAHPWSLFVSEVLFVPTRGAHDLRAGRSWRGTHTGQVHVHDAVALRLSVESRVEAVTRAGNAPVPDTGGFLLHVAPGVVVSPVDDVVVQFVVHVPVVNALYGRHDEGPVFEVGAAFDL